MKRSGLTLLGLFAMLLLGSQALSAQSTTTLAQKEAHALQSTVNYDVWKASVTTETEPSHKLMRTRQVENGKYYLIRLGNDLQDQEAAKNFEKKIAGQPGVLSVRANHFNDTVEVTIKEEDEHNFLQSCFGIE